MSIPRTVTVPRRVLVGPVTGTRYKTSRRLGLIRGQMPNPNEQVWLDAVLRVQTRMPDLLPLTPRAYAYRIAGEPGFTKEIAVAGIVDFLVLARRCEWIGWNTVDDSRTRTIDVPSDLTTAALDERLVNVAENWTRWPRLFQKWVPEIWVEAVGSMTSVVEPARRFGASIVSSGGMNSLTEIRKLVDRVAGRWYDHEMRTVVMLIGDYDEAGRTRFDRAIADARMLLRDLYVKKASGEDAEWVAEYLLDFEWVAVTPDQINGVRPFHDWMLAPSDVAGTKYEVEAIDPAQLRDHLSAVLTRYTNKRMLERVLVASQREGKYRAECLSDAVTGRAARQS